MPREDAGMQDIQTAVPSTTGRYHLRQLPEFLRSERAKYSHTISRLLVSGAQHLLSASVLRAADCMTADAYATAFMAWPEKVFAFSASAPGIEGYFLYNQEDGTFGVRFIRRPAPFV